MWRPRWSTCWCASAAVVCGSHVGRGSLQVDSRHNTTLGGYCSRFRFQSYVVQINVDETWSANFIDVQECTAFSHLSLQYVLAHYKSCCFIALMLFRVSSLSCISIIQMTFPSNRWHMSNDYCLELGRKIIRTILCCFVYSSCTHWYAHTREQLLNLCVILGLHFLCLFRFSIFMLFVLT